MPRSATRKPARRPGKKTSARPRPPTPALSPRGEETRARLLAAAYDEFRANGYHGTSMRQIARAAGLAVGGIYNHFHSKEEVFAAVFDARHPYRRILPALQAARGDTLEDYVRDIGQRLQTAVEGVEDQLLPLVFIEMVEFQGRHLQALAERLFPQMMALAQSFVERGGHRLDLPLPVVMRAFVSLFIGYVLTGMFLRGVPAVQAMPYAWFDGLLDIFLHGVVVRDSRAGDPGPAEA